MSEEVQDRIEKMIKKSEAILNAGKEKLKPCPFCGGEAELEINGLYWDVNCKRCLANVGAYKCYNKKQAVEAWNKRYKGDKE